MLIFAVALASGGRSAPGRTWRKSLPTYGHHPHLGRWKTYKSDGEGVEESQSLKGKGHSQPSKKLRDGDCALPKSTNEVDAPTLLGQMLAALASIDHVPASLLSQV